MMQALATEDKTLEELEGLAWRESPASEVAPVIHSLRRKPLAEFTPLDLRLMIQEGVGLPFLVPMALEYLEQAPLEPAGGEPGSLLLSVIHADHCFWRTHPQQRLRLNSLVVRVEALAGRLQREVVPALRAFRAQRPSVSPVSPD